MVPINNLSLSTTSYLLLILQVFKVSKQSLERYFIMHALSTKSSQLLSVPLVIKNQLPLKPLLMSSNNSQITFLRIQMVVLFIAQVTWLFMTILTLDFTMNSKSTAAQGSTYFYLIMTLILDGMDLSSPFPKLSNLS